MKDTIEKSDQYLDEKILTYALESDDIDLFRQEFLESHPYNQAEFFLQLSAQLRKKMYYFLSPKELATIMEIVEVENDDNIELLLEMDEHYAAEMMSEMYVDEAVDLLGLLPKEQIKQYLSLMDRESAHSIENLLQYKEFTAGSLMTTDYVAIHANQTILSAMDTIRHRATEAETIYYVYVIDENNRLLGVISLRDLILNSEETYVSDIVNDRIVKVNVLDDQEEVAKVIRDYKLLAVPVIDSSNTLLGIITVDDIVEVIDEESTDDYSKFAGVTDMDTVDKSSFSAAKKRLPWLIVLLFLSMGTVTLISKFEETLDQVAILGAFISLIAGMAGNTGTQALAVAIRGLTTGESNEESKWKLIGREFGTGTINGLVCGVLILFIIGYWQHNYFLGFIVGISIFLSLIVATLAGVLIPLLMDKLKIDPAVASGPFITTINDIFSLFIYFSVATMLMAYL